MAPAYACRSDTLQPERLSRFLHENPYPKCAEFRCPDLDYKSKESEFFFFVFSTTTLQLTVSRNEVMNELTVQFLMLC